MWDPRISGAARKEDSPLILFLLQSTLKVSHLGNNFLNQPDPLRQQGDNDTQEETILHRNAAEISAHEGRGKRKATSDDLANIAGHSVKWI
jgi:hypothetical protein